MANRSAHLTLGGIRGRGRSKGPQGSQMPSLHHGVPGTALLPRRFLEKMELFHLGAPTDFNEGVLGGERSVYCSFLLRIPVWVAVRICNLETHILTVHINYWLKLASKKTPLCEIPFFTTRRARIFADFSPRPPHGFLEFQPLLECICHLKHRSVLSPNLSCAY